MTFLLKKKALKKLVSSLTMLTTVVSMTGMMALSSITIAAEGVVDGDLIKSNATNSDGTPTYESLDIYIVKIVGTKQFKRLVLNPTVFESYGHLNYGDVQTIDQVDMNTYTTSSLVRVDTDPDEKVYAMTPDGDIGSKSWLNLTTAEAASVTEYDAEGVYTINETDGGNYNTVGDVTTPAELTTFYADGTLPAGEGTPPVPSGGDLAVALSASTPASMTIPTNSSVEFVRVNLSAGDEATSVTAIKVTASGLGVSTEIDDVTLYVDGTKVGSSKSINSSREATFNFSTPIELAANATKELSMKATIVDDNAPVGVGSYVLGIKTATDVITTGGLVTGSFPVAGNGMSASATTAVGTVALSALSNTASAPNFGEDNVLLAGFDLTPSNEAVLFESMRLRNGGTNVDGIVSNLKLIIDGTEVATAEPVNGDIDFAVGNYRIEKSSAASVEVYGDIGVSNVGNTVALYIKNRTDLVFVGEDYGFGVQLTTATYALLDSSTEGIIATLASGDISLDMDKSATPAKDVKAGDNDVVLGTLKITSNGENATISQIVDSGVADDFEIQGTGLAAGEIENVEMRNTATGAVYDIQATRVSDTEWTLSMTEEISLVLGETKTFEIRADMSDTVGVEIDNGDTLKVVVGGTAMSITGDVSNATITNVTPSSVTSSITTIKDASLDISTTSLNSLTVVSGAEEVVIYQATVKAGTADDVKLTSVVLTTLATGLNDFTDNNISKIDLLLDGVLIRSLSNSIAEGTAAPAATGSVTFSSLITTGDANVIPAGETVTLIAKATFASSLTPVTTFSLGLDSATTSIIARSVDGNDLIVETVGNVGTGSRTIGVAAKGTLKVNLLITDTKADQNSYILAGLASADDEYLAELEFTTTDEPIILQELRLKDSSSATSSDIASVSLVDSTGAVIVSQIPEANGDVIFDPISVELPADQVTSLFISVETKGMNVDGEPSSTATHANSAIYNINPVAGVVAQGKNSGETIALAADGVTAVAQVNTVTPGGTITATDAFNVAGIATGTVTFTATAGTVANVTAGLTAAINAAPAGITVTAVDNTTHVTITAITAGTAFTAVPTTTDGNADGLETLATAITTPNVTSAAGTVTVGEWSHESVVSKTGIVSGSVLNSIVSDMADGTLTGGLGKVIGKYKVVFDNGSNRKSDNTELKAILDAFTITVSKTAAVTTLNVSIQIEGAGSKVANSDAGTSANYTWTNLEMRNLANSGEVDGEIVLVITADVGTTTDQYLQTSIADLDGAGSNDDFAFIGDGLTATAPFTDMYLSVDEAIGGTLSN